MKLNFFNLLAFFVLFVSCSTLSKQESVTVIDYPEALSDAKYYYKNNNFERAEAEVQRYLSSGKDIYYQGHAYLLLGEIRETSGQDAQAIEAYRQVVSHAAGYHSAAGAQALYRMTWIFERDKKYNDLLITLLDLERALGQGDNFIKHIETPARLANTYYVLNQWDKAITQRERITDEIIQRYKAQAKTSMIEFQSKLYRSFLGMEPITTTPFKSQDILNLTQKELLSVAEVSESEIAERAFKGIENEYERYFSQVKLLSDAANAVDVAKRNKAKLVELAQFLDFIEELRAVRRPPELVANQKLNLAFFKTLQAYEDQARALSKKLEIGVQKANKGKNPFEKFEDAPEKTPQPVRSKNSKKL